MYSSRILNGGDPQDNPITDVNTTGETRGERTKKVMTALLTKFKTEDENSSMIDLRTTGIHAFTGLPNHPSLDKLKEGDDPAAAIEKHLLEPGRKMAETTLSTGKTAVLFDRQVEDMSTWSLYEDGEDMLAEIRKKRPTEGMTPKELKEHIDEVSKDLKAYIAKCRADKWKKDKEADGETVSDEDLEKRIAKVKGWADGWSDSAFTNTMVDALDPPEFVVADTNWGDKGSHTFFVVIPDPVTGEPRMFKKDEPSGELRDLDEDWTDTNWQVTE